MPYRHLSEQEREEIAQMRFAGHSFSEIARTLGRQTSTISREVGRNQCRVGNRRFVKMRYYVGAAHELAKQRRRRAKASLPAVLDDIELLNYVKLGLKQRWSPEQIAGRIRADHPDDSSMRVSHETIYQWVRQDKRNGGKWYRFLRQANRQRRKKYRSSLRRYRIQNQKSIDSRPQVVEQRTRIGDWEGDTVEGKNHQGRLLTLVDRKSRFTIALKLENKTSAKTVAAIHRALSQLPPTARRTLTLDNGTEFTHFQTIEERLNTTVYFAHPYSSWERGTNENTNGLLRQYFPKQTNFNEITTQRLAADVIQLNNRPRKCLNWRTPKEVFLAK